MAISFILIFCSASLIDFIGFRTPQPVTISKADAYVRGVSRRTARRTARRTSYRHDYYRRPVVYGAGAVAATAAAISIGTRVAALPAGCRKITVNGRLYYDCSGTYYQPKYDGPDVVYVVVKNPN
jgi:hypothetical protein